MDVSSPPQNPKKSLFRAVDGASLAVFRIVFGVAMACQIVRYYLKGWIESKYVEPDFHFSYPFFDWVPKLAGEWAYFEFGALFVLSLLVAVGLFFRVSATLLFLIHTHWFLIDKVYYNNHYYLQALVAFLLIFLPAHRVWSLDARRTSRARAAVPFWSVGLLRFQMGVVYVFGGLAKFDPDWLTGVPIRAILGEHRSKPLLGPFVGSESGGLFFAWSGLFLDLLVVPFLLWRRTRCIAFLAITLFHLCNHYLFRIGVFPWLMIGATTIFFAPDWPRRAWARLRGRNEPTLELRSLPQSNRRGLVLGALGLWAVVQVVLPLRHFLYPTRVTWGEEGFHFSWHMMLRHKITQGRFLVLDEDGDSVADDDDLPLSTNQWGFMQYDPDTIRQFAVLLAERARAKGVVNPTVRAFVLCSLNGREPQYLVNPDVDLSRIGPSLAPMDWIVPLAERDVPDEPYGGNL